QRIGAAAARRVVLSSARISFQAHASRRTYPRAAAERNDAAAGSSRKFRGNELVVDARRSSTNELPGGFRDQYHPHLRTDYSACGRYHRYHGKYAVRRRRGRRCLENDEWRRKL